VDATNSGPPTKQLPLVLVTVGTDHHVFDRMIDWMDAYAESRQGRARFVVQHGHSRAPRAPGVEGTAIFEFDEFQQLLDTADILVTGGPITIFEALEHGLRPIVVPRELARKEHIDNNQVDFAVHFAEGRFEYPTDREELFALLDDALAHPGSRRFDPSGVPQPPGITRIAAVVDALVWGQEAP
jgi:UDP-N-acetylglucosamine transferase subunit ALG13